MATRYDIDIFYSVLGNKIREARKAKGIDQETLALSIGLTRTSMINIEKARQRPSIYQIYLISNLLEIQLVDLIPSPDLENEINHWIEKVNNSDQVTDESQKRNILEFIHVSRNVNK